MKVLIVHPDHTTEVREAEATAAQMQELVGGWIEGVGHSIDSDWCAYADEEGRLKGLPVNPLATALARREGWPGDFLVGPVVFMGQEWRAEDGNVEVDVPRRFIEAVSS